MVLGPTRRSAPRSRSGLLRNEEPRHSAGQTPLHALPAPGTRFEALVLLLVGLDRLVLVLVLVAAMVHSRTPPSFLPLLSVCVCRCMLAQHTVEIEKHGAPSGGMGGGVPGAQGMGY